MVENKPLRSGAPSTRAEFQQRFTRRQPEPATESLPTTTDNSTNTPNPRLAALEAEQRANELRQQELTDEIRFIQNEEIPAAEREFRETGNKGRLRRALNKADSLAAERQRLRNDANDLNRKLKKARGEPTRSFEERATPTEIALVARRQPETRAAFAEQQEFQRDKIKEEEIKIQAGITGQIKARQKIFLETRGGFSEEEARSFVKDDTPIAKVVRKPIREENGKLISSSFLIGAQEQRVSTIGLIEVVKNGNRISTRESDFLFAIDRSVGLANLVSDQERFQKQGARIQAERSGLILQAVNALTKSVNNPRQINTITDASGVGLEFGSGFLQASLDTFVPIVRGVYKVEREGLGISSVLAPPRFDSVQPASISPASNLEVERYVTAINKRIGGKDLSKTQRENLEDPDVKSAQAAGVLIGGGLMSPLAFVIVGGGLAARQTVQETQVFLADPTPSNLGRVTFAGATTLLAIKPAAGVNKLKVRNVAITTKEKGTVRATSLVLESGTRADPLVTVSTTERIILGGEKVKIRRTKTGQIKEIGEDVSPLEISFGRDIRSRVRPSELKGKVNLPETAGGALVFRELLSLSKKERIRIDSVIEGSKAVRFEKGLLVEEFPNLRQEGVRNPEFVTGVVQDLASDLNAVAFGTITTGRKGAKGQLPERFGQFTRQSDVDLEAPLFKVEEIQSVMKRYEKILQEGGERVFLTEDNVFKFFDDAGSNAPDGKLLEVKSGINQKILGLGDEAPGGFAGIKVGDYDSVTFGKIEAIPAGEQAVRKGQAVTTTRPRDLEAPPDFIEGGVLPPAKRTLKDITGFYLSLRGIAELQAKSPFESTRLNSIRANLMADEFIKSFNMNQRKALVEYIDEIAPDSLVDVKIPLRQPKQVSPLSKTKVSPKISEPNFLQTARSLSPSRPQRSKTILSPITRISTLPSTIIPQNSLVPASPSVKQPTSFFTSSPITTSLIPVSPSPTISTSPSASLSPSPLRSFYSSPSVTSRSFFPVQSKTKNPSITTGDLPTSNLQAGFALFVRRKGEFAEVGVFTREEALALGQLITSGTSARSFFLKEAGIRVAESGRQLPRFASERFRRPKGKTKLQGGEIFVEKSKFAIDTPGEFFEISLKGQQARRRK